MKLSLLLVLMFSYAGAQHLSASIRESGLKKVIISALETYSQSSERIEFVIPSRTSHLKLKKEDLNNYQIIKDIKEFGYIDFSKDLNYFIRWAPMTVEFKLNPDKYKFDFEGVTSNMNLLAKGVVDYVRIRSKWFELCETVNKKCIKKSGVYIKVNNFDIRLEPNEFIDALISLNIKTDEDHVNIKNNGLYSSLFAPRTKKARELHKQFNLRQYSPKIKVGFDSLDIPDLELRVGDRVTTLDTSGLKEVILKHKNVLSKQLFHIVGKFITEDLSKEVTRSIIGSLKTITKKIQIFNFDPQTTRGSLVEEVNGGFELNDSNLDEDSFMNNLISMLMDMVYYSRVELEYLMAKVETDKSLRFDYDLSILVNDLRTQVGKSILNGHGVFKEPTFSWIKDDYDLSIAIGEPFLNGVLKTAVDSGLVEKVFTDMVKLDGVSVRDLHIHFDQVSKTDYRNSNTDRSMKKDELIRNGVSTGHFTVVAEVQVNFKELEGSGWTWVENRFASMLEGGKVWFPLELRFKPQVVESEGKQYLRILLDQKKTTKTLPNRFGYDYKDMYGKVEKGIIKKINAALFEKLEDIPMIDITNYLAMPGLSAKPVGVKFFNSGHMGLQLEVKELHLKNLVEFIGGNK